MEVNFIFMVLCFVTLY